MSKKIESIKSDFYLIRGLFISLLYDCVHTTDEHFIHLLSLLVWNESCKRSHDIRKKNCSCNQKIKLYFLNVCFYNVFERLNELSSQFSACCDSICSFFLIVQLKILSLVMLYNIQKNNVSGLKKVKEKNI